MKPYMSFSRSYGPQEGAFLVVANSAREAKKLAWKQCPMLVSMEDVNAYINAALDIALDPL